MRALQLSWTCETWVITVQMAPAVAQGYSQSMKVGSVFTPTSPPVSRCGSTKISGQVKQKATGASDRANSDGRHAARLRRDQVRVPASAHFSGDCAAKIGALAMPRVEKKPLKMKPPLSSSDSGSPGGGVSKW